ncbi:3-octaprenyl-4-hydroxybenzoate carboxy-lyase [Nodularia spumigena CENA596]|uniref:3-octaprenyl-4-hydroxybenzoate carboxy-lyase n=1 Tax=Nodularia spumigena CENA596 TaxID=1819295 RepID=A0A166IZF2_NODSP|nr:3-octaprenyl-4-hydroxybenzoate carboxy-lyase [Nodularia spumigena CCY9414]EAW43508.1 3-octaprenyl-4-hydroxybenzoate carboxy-lyase [Nodularia spumigena CCY9414]KZL49048.1 3-octaprenyl-4-hydroxybenzoate carboxy-lyase [Nodularia spumigena CENA596]
MRPDAPDMPNIRGLGLFDTGLLVKLIAGQNLRNWGIALISTPGDGGK